MTDNVVKWFKSGQTILTEREVVKGKTEYRENDKKITKSDDDQQDIDEAEFKIMVQKATQKFINKNFEKVILLSGSGTSVTGDPDNPLGKTMKDLVSEVDDALKNNKNYFNFEGLAKLIKFDIPKKEKQVLDIDHINLEDFLSTIIRFEPFVSNRDKQKYQKTKNKILTVIKDNTSYDYNSELLKHTSVMNSLAKRVKSPYKLTVVTTNYDTMFEEAAEEIEYTVIDGFTYSLTPHFNSDEFEWNLVKNIPNVKTKELEYKQNVVDLLKIHGSLTWERENRIIYRKSKKQVKNPILIFPSSNKYAQSYEEPYFDLFAKFQEILMQNNTLLITSGFSFGDSHIASMVEHAVKRNRGLALLVTDFNIDQNGEYWANIEKLVDDKFSVAFLKSSFNDLPNYVG